MSICRVAMMSFMWGDVDRGTGDRQLYSDNDLRDLIGYAESYMEEGLTHEPVDRFNLADFRDWCKRELRGNPKGKRHG